MSSEWAEINEFLKSLNYMHYASLFKNAGYDLWEIMSDLTVDDLTGIGIKPGHSRRIQKQLSIKKAEKSNETQQTADMALTNASERAKQEIIFAEKLKNQLFQTMTRVLNGLQQQLVEMNVRFAEPILSLQRVIVAEKSKDYTQIEESDAHIMLFDTLLRFINNLKLSNDKMWSTITQFRRLADLHINDAAEQIQHQINTFNQLKNEYRPNNLHKHHHTLHKTSSHQTPSHQTPPHQTQHQLNTIVLNLDLKNDIKGCNTLPNPPNNGIKTSSSIPPYTLGEIKIIKNAVKEQNGIRLNIMELQSKMQSASGYIRDPVDIVHKMQSMGLRKNKAMDQDLLMHNNDNGTTIRDYTAQEMHFIRTLIGEHPNSDTNALFASFRGHFNYWKDDKESYNKFYKTIWKVCEELIDRKRAPETSFQNEPKRKKSKLNGNV